MKKILFFATLLVVCCSASLSAHKSFVLKEKMSIEQLVVNYPIVVFRDNLETKKEIVRLAKASPSKLNFFVLWNYDTNVMTYYVVFFSNRTNTWHIDSFTSFKCLDPGVRVFSRE